LTNDKNIFDTNYVLFKKSAKVFEVGLSVSGGVRIGCIGDLLVEFVGSSRNGRHRREGRRHVWTVPIVRMMVGR
jgi:hypothetical protein